MSSKNLCQATKRILYGAGIGEAPAIRRSASSGSPAISNGYLTGLTMETGEAAKVAPGQLLSLLNSTDDSDAIVIYVTNVSGDDIDGVVDYHGAPIGSATDYEGALFEVKPDNSELEIHKVIDTVIETQLFPDVFDITTTTLTPDLANLTHDMPADTEDIVRVTQLIGSDPYRLAYGLSRNEHTTISANGNLLTFEPLNGILFFPCHCSLV